MELECVEDYSDTKFIMKCGDLTSHLHGISEEHKINMIRDFPNKFKVISTEEQHHDSTFVIENKESKLKVITKTKKSKM